MKTKPQTKAIKSPPGPTEWQAGAIKLSGRPAKPISGLGHARIRLLGSDCPRDERAARSWFYDKLCGKRRGRAGGHAAFVTAGSSRMEFLSPEAHQLWCDHNAFWTREHQASAALKKTAAQATARVASRKKGRQLKRAAAKAAVPATELKAKLQRLKALLEDREARPLAIELIRAAEPWLLEALLAGASLRNNELSGGSYFKQLSSNCDDGTSILFWLTVARACAAGCCPRAFNCKQLSRLSLRPRDAVEMEVVTEDILPHLPWVQELELQYWAFTFSTAAMPVMPVLSRLLLTNGDTGFLLTNGDTGSGCGICLESLDKQKRLEACYVRGPASLRVADDQVPLFERVRLEITQGSCSIDSEGLRAIKGPPETWSGVTELNLPAARVLVRMCSDHSNSPNPPQWWRQIWTLPDVVSEVDGEVANFLWPESPELPLGFYAMDVREAKTKRIVRHLVPLGHDNRFGYGGEVYKGAMLAARPERWLALTLLESVSVEVAELAVSANAPIRIAARLLTPEILGRLMSSKSALFIEVVGDDELAPATASALTAFSGSQLIVGLRTTLAEKVATALSAFTGKSTLRADLGLAEPGCSKLSAEALVRKQGGLRIEGLWRLDAETLEVLGRRADFDLGEHRLRYFEKRNANGGSFCKLQLGYNHAKREYEASVTKGRIGATGHTKTVRITSWWNREIPVNQLLREGYQEVAPGTHPAG